MTKLLRLQEQMFESVCVMRHANIEVRTRALLHCSDVVRVQSAEVFLSTARRLVSVNDHQWHNSRWQQRWLA